MPKPATEDGAFRFISGWWLWWYWVPTYEHDEESHKTQMYHSSLSWLCFMLQWDLRDYR